MEEVTTVLDMLKLYGYYAFKKEKDDIDRAKENINYSGYTYFGFENDKEETRCFVVPSNTELNKVRNDDRYTLIFLKSIKDIEDTLNTMYGPVKDIKQSRIDTTNIQQMIR